ncbi:Ig-like domain-containing protein [candidate division KSB1 bacterium]|nr:Ig-like domain-containing protein [candidate division KSB1 bacterium]
MMAIILPTNKSARKDAKTQRFRKDFSLRDLCGFAALHECFCLLETRAFVLLTFCIFIWNCARQAAPPGGPEDKTAPRILKVSPQPDSTRVSRDAHLVFSFSEKVDHKSFEDAIFVSPSPSLATPDEEEFRFKWRGRQVEVSFPDSLRAQRTYVVTVGTELRDLRNNRMENAFTFAFSTGDSLDRGEIKGRVFADRPAGILIMAYILDHEREPNASTDYADYFTQLGESGEFTLSALAPGKYRLFVLGDRDGDRLYTRGEELLGVPTHDVSLTSAGANLRPLGFRLATEDTLRPTLSAVTVLSGNQLEWRFDEAVAPRDSLWENHLHVRAENGDSLQIVRAARPPLDRGLVQTIIAPLQSLKYIGTATALFDEAGNELDSLARTSEFTGTTLADTTRPRVVKISVADSARNVLPAAPVEVIFSEIMKTDTSARPLLVQDSSGAEVEGGLHWLNAFQFRFQPQPHWKSRARYTVTIQRDKIFDWNGNALFDTTGQITFWTVNADTFASISGKITDADTTARGAIHLTAKQAGGKVEYHVQTDSARAYHFKEVLPGLYQINAFRDVNGNGLFDFGKALPFLPAERYWAWPDTIKVRSRWPNENNDFVIP